MTALILTCILKIRRLYNNYIYNIYTLYFFMVNNNRKSWQNDVNSIKYIN
jgi:hypothetical protein